ncbi:unnamed protein product, partial [Staurois parvus]
MQTASTNIFERMGRSQELSDFKRGTVIGYHLCNKSIHEISLLLNIPGSTVHGIVTEWKELGRTATQPQSGKPRKMTEQGQHMLKCTVRISRQLSAKDLQTLFPVKGALMESAYQDILDNSMLPTLWDGPFLFHHDCKAV